MIGVGISAGLTGAKRARSIQDPLPALDLDWATDRSLPAAYGPTPSFSRASTGTYFTSSGVLSSAAINAPRFNHVYNGSSWVSKGLLIEEQRTNTATYSEDFSNASWIKTTATISANLAAAPDGTTTADLCYPTSTGTYRGFYRSFSSAAVSMSIFAKSSGKTAFAFIASDGNTVGASFNLATGTVSNVFSGHTASIENCGDGWYRCKMAATTTAMQVFIQDAQGSSVTVTTNSTDGVLFWGAQIELGAFPNSYIPTTTAAVTRSADVCQITGTDFSGFWNASEGSLVVQYDRHNVPTSNGVLFAASKVSSPLQNLIYNFASSGNENLSVYNGNIEQATFAIGSIPSVGTSAKIGFCYKVNDFAGTLNGSAVVADTSGSVTAVEQIGIGYIHGTTANFNGHISRLSYYPTRLTNAKLQELST